MDLTILIVTRDRPLLLEHAIRSVEASARAAADRVATEILVIDDSEDRTAEPVAAALGVECRWNPVRVPRYGLYAGRAWALPQVRTDLVALFDDDDLMLEDHIPRLVDRVVGGAEICATGYWYADADPADVTKLIPRPRPARPRQPRLGDLLRGYQPVNDGAMMPTDVAKSVAWDPSREMVMMYDIWLQLALAGRRFVVNPTPTFLYRQHAGGLSRRFGEHEATISADMLEAARRKAIDQFGRVPGPSLDVRLRELRATARRAVGS